MIWNANNNTHRIIINCIFAINFKMNFQLKLCVNYYEIWFYGTLLSLKMINIHIKLLEMNDRTNFSEFIFLSYMLDWCVDIYLFYDNKLISICEMIFNSICFRQTFNAIRMDVFDSKTAFIYRGTIRFCKVWWKEF